MTASSLERRIDRLESRALIAELGSAYCIACDDHDIVRLRGLFTDDVVIRSLDGKMDASGIDQVMAMFDAMFAIRGPAYHWTHDRFVTFDDADPDRATGQVLAHAETTPDGVPSLAALRYEDEYRRVDGAWKFARRLLSFLYYMPIRDYADRMATSERFFDKGGYRASDYPEKLAAWQLYLARRRSAS